MYIPVLADDMSIRVLALGGTVLVITILPALSKTDTLTGASVPETSILTEGDVMRVGNTLTEDD